MGLKSWSRLGCRPRRAVFRARQGGWRLLTSRTLHALRAVRIVSRGLCHETLGYFGAFAALPGLGCCTRLWTSLQSLVWRIDCW